jgi:hypothetical protein
MFSISKILIEHTAGICADFLFRLSFVLMPPRNTARDQKKLATRAIILPRFGRSDYRMAARSLFKRKN